MSAKNVGAQNFQPVKDAAKNDQMTNQRFTALALSIIIGWLIGTALKQDPLQAQLNRIEANQIELIENQAAMFQDSFHSNE